MPAPSRCHIRWCPSPFAVAESPSRAPHPRITNPALELVKNECRQRFYPAGVPHTSASQASDSSAIALALLAGAGREDKKDEQAEAEEEEKGGREAQS